MTIDKFSDLVHSIDPDAVRYERIGQKGDAYTVFSDYMTDFLPANDVPAEMVQHIQVDYFTRTENDPRALQFLTAFSHHDDITCDYQTDFESDSRYIHHIYDLEVIFEHVQLPG